MKIKINQIKLIILLVYLLVSVLQAQLSMPRISPAAEITQTVGLSKIVINYSRPGVKGREIWGKLVPWGLAKNSIGTQEHIPWRAGANENTTIEFSHDALVNGNEIKAGKYGLHIIPRKPSEWIIIFSKDNSAWGSFFYDSTNDAFRINVKPVNNLHKEWLEYSFGDLTENSCAIILRWEKIELSFTVQFDVHKIVIENLKHQLKSLTGFNWQSWNQAAAYCLQINNYFDEAEIWCKTSIKLNENANNRNLLGYILFAKGKTKEAKNLLEENTIIYPNTWNTYESYAEILNKTGDKLLSKKYYEKAVQLAPANQKERIKLILSSFDNNE